MNTGNHETIWCTFFPSYCSHKYPRKLPAGVFSLLEIGGDRHQQAACDV